MFYNMLASTKYIILIVVLSIYAGSVALILYETAVVATVIFGTIQDATVSPEGGRLLAVGLLAAIDVFLIAIVGYIISAGLFVLFIDKSLPLPVWLVIRNLEDLKSNLISVIVAVLAVLFAKEAVARTGELDLLGLGIAVALMIGVLALFLVVTASTHGPTKAPGPGEQESQRDE